MPIFTFDIIIEIFGKRKDLGRIPFVFFQFVRSMSGRKSAHTPTGSFFSPSAAGKVSAVIAARTC